MSRADEEEGKKPLQVQVSSFCIVSASPSPCSQARARPSHNLEASHEQSPLHLGYARFTQLLTTFTMHSRPHVLVGQASSATAFRPSRGAARREDWRVALGPKFVWRGRFQFGALGRKAAEKRPKLHQCCTLDWQAWTSLHLLAMLAS